MSKRRLEKRARLMGTNRILELEKELQEARSRIDELETVLNLVVKAYDWDWSDELRKLAENLLDKTGIEYWAVENLGTVNCRFCGQRGPELDKVIHAKNCPVLQTTKKKGYYGIMGRSRKH